MLPRTQQYDDSTQATSKLREQWEIGVSMTGSIQ